jgi:hypothetical protein
LNVYMGSRLDTDVALERTRLCKLGGVSRGKHIRWSTAGLLVEKSLYDELDLIHAVALDQLTRTVKPQLAQAAWRQIRHSLDPDAARVEVVLSPGTHRAFLTGGAVELDQVLPRNQVVVVVELTTRIREARTQLDDYRASERDAQQPQDDGPPIRDTLSEMT